MIRVNRQQRKNSYVWPEHIFDFYEEFFQRFLRYGWDEEEAEREARKWASEKFAAIKKSHAI